MGAITPTGIFTRIGDWLRRNWKWLVGIVLLIIIILLLGPCGQGYKYGMGKINSWRTPTAQQPTDNTINNKLDELLLAQAKCCKDPEIKVNVPDGCTVETQDNVANVICPPCQECEDCKPPPKKPCKGKDCKKPKPKPELPPKLAPEKPKQTGCTNRVITSQVDVIGIYCTGFDYPGTKLNGTNVTGRYHTFSPRKSVTICVPPGGRLGHYNLKAAEGHWAVGTERAKIDGNREVADPNFDTAVDGQPSNSGNSRKMGNDWIYRVDEPEPTTAPQPNGTTFDTGN